MKFRQAYNNFSSGEWSPKMRARPDTDAYSKSCETLKNAIPRIQGGAFRRFGNQSISLSAGNKADLGTTTLLVEYNTSIGGQYVLVINGTTLADWFVYNVASGATSSITSATATISYTPVKLHHQQVGDLIFFCSSGLNIAAGEEPFIFWLTSAGVFRVDKYLTYVAAQRAGQNIWEALPYRDYDTSGITLTPGATTGSTTLTASAAFFNVTHPGTYFKITHGAPYVTGVCVVTAYTSATQVSIDIKKTMGGATASAIWEESAWNNYRGWPRTLTAYQGRMVYGSNKTQPDTIWGSEIGNIFRLMELPLSDAADFTTYVNDNGRAFTLTPNMAQSSNIVALISGKTLVINTDTNEIIAYGTNGALGPNDVQFENSSSFGASDVMPKKVNNYVTFVQANGKQIRDVTFNLDENQYKSADLSFVADHLFNRDDDAESQALGFPGVVQSLALNRADSVLWILRDTGHLYGLTLDRDYNVNGFFRYETDTVVATGKGRVHAICTGKTVDALGFQGLDALYMVVNRGTSASPDFYFEYLPSGDWYLDDCPTGTGAGSCKFVDAPLAAGGTGTSWTGLTKYANETVSVFVDGVYQGDQIVSGTGTLTTTTSGSACVVGLPYTTIIKTMPIELGQQVPGSPLGFIKRIDEIVLKFRRSYGCRYGRTEDDLFAVPFTDPATGVAPTMQDISKAVTNPGVYENEVQVVVEQSKPYPCNLLCISSRAVLYD